MTTTAEQVGYSIPEWCTATGISAGMYFKQKRLGRGPRIAHIGRRTLVIESPREYFARINLEAASRPRGAKASNTEAVDSP